MAQAHRRQGFFLHLEPPDTVIRRCITIGCRYEERIYRVGFDGVSLYHLPPSYLSPLHLRHVVPTLLYQWHCAWFSEGLSYLTLRAIMQDWSTHPLVLAESISIFFFAILSSPIAHWHPGPCCRALCMGSSYKTLSVYRQRPICWPASPSYIKTSATMTPTPRLALHLGLASCPAEVDCQCLDDHQDKLSPSACEYCRQVVVGRHCISSNKPAPSLHRGILTL